MCQRPRPFGNLPDANGLTQALFHLVAVLAAVLVNPAERLPVNVAHEARNGLQVNAPDDGIGCERVPNRAGGDAKAQLLAQPQTAVVECTRVPGGTKGPDKGVGILCSCAQTAEGRNVVSHIAVLAEHEECLIISQVGHAHHA